MIFFILIKFKWLINMIYWIRNPWIWYWESEYDAFLAVLLCLRLALIMVRVWQGQSSASSSLLIELLSVTRVVGSYQALQNPSPWPSVFLDWKKVKEETFFRSRMFFTWKTAFNAAAFMYEKPASPQSLLSSKQMGRRKISFFPAIQRKEIFPFCYSSKVQIAIQAKLSSTDLYHWLC